MADVMENMKGMGNKMENKAHELKGQAKARMQQMKEQSEQRSANEE